MSQVNNMMSYADLINLLRTHLGENRSGRITGISEKQHSFQIGFEKGKIVFLTYRVFKSTAALEKLLLIETAKIAEHLGVSTPSQQIDLPDTGAIMARLSMGKYAVSGGDLADENINSSPEPTLSSDQSSAGSNQVSTPVRTQIDVSELENIKRSAVHSFGPFATMMCDKHLTPSSLANADLKTLLIRIARDLGASDTDTRAFIDQFIR